MIALADTHVFAWALDRTQGSLSPPVLEAMNGATTLLVSTIAFYEIALKVRLGKWAEMESRVDALHDDAVSMGFSVQPPSSSDAVQAGLLDWSNRDPFDRIILATALGYDATLLTKDRSFHDYSKQQTEKSLKVLW